MCFFLFVAKASVDVCILSVRGVRVGVCGCDKTLKAFWKKFCDTPQVRVTADASLPSVLPMLHKVLETGLLRLDLSFFKALSNKGL